LTIVGKPHVFFDEVTPLNRTYLEGVKAIQESIILITLTQIGKR